jgi:hypothetical protein
VGVVGVITSGAAVHEASSVVSITPLIIKAMALLFIRSFFILQSPSVVGRFENRVSSIGIPPCFSV